MVVSLSLVAAHIAAVSVTSFILRGFLSFASITDALGFYGVYHRDPINQIIHFFGVPCIIWSLIVFLCHLNLLLFHFKIDIPFIAPHDVSYATLVTAMYIGFYLYLDHFGGVLYIPFAYGMYALAVNMMNQDQNLAKVELQKKEKKSSTSWTGTGRLLRLAAIVHFTGWYVQIHPGHGIFEGAKPAVLQSIGGALTSAPLFAYYEGLWFIGLNKGLQEETKVLVDQYTVELCRKGIDMRACADYDLN